MTHLVTYSPRARRQLLEIIDYIEQKASAAIADRFAGDIVEYCNGFGIFPHRGERRDDLSPGLRLVGFRRRVTIAFRVKEDEVLIAGIFYGGQDIETAFSED